MSPRPVLFVLALLVLGSIAQGVTLEEAFRNPPATAKPWVFWFWLNGNITKEGITLDLEAMQRVGIGGALIMEVDQGVPVGPVDFMSPKWRELFRHMVAEAGRLGLQINMNNDAGWNGSGGPWVKPEVSMQKVVFGESKIVGGRRVDVVLPQPEIVAGYYRDIAVLAFPSGNYDRVDEIKIKAAYEIGRRNSEKSDNPTATSAIEAARILDLTKQVDAAGRLVWDAPAGDWTVVRFGHTSTGVPNAPAPATGRGLECDKLSKEGVEANFNGMMAQLVADVGPAAGKVLVATHVDSWEVDSQNWTRRMRDEFRTRRGYDIMPYLPVMTGRVVGSRAVAERFLWDLRRTISELVVENYAGHLCDLAHRHGLRFTTEAYGSPCDFLPYAGRCDEPMGEFWIGGNELITCKGMASAAHIYGKPIIGAEAFTAGDHERWREHPATIKALGDRAFCEGINRLVFHRYAMQPWTDRRPGMTMGPWGIHYERTQTWWNLTPDWHRYLARCQSLLRQGRHVADICYLEPEDSPQGFHDHPRRGYAWDQCCAEVVLQQMTVENGRLVLPSGATYRVLVLPEMSTITPALLRKVKELAVAGATVIGRRPTESPSLSDYPRCDQEIRRLADELWADCDGHINQEHRLGKGRIISALTPEEVLMASGVGPDFASLAGLHFIHRRTDNEDVYFVANPSPREVTTVATFRAAGRQPEFWWPDTGKMQPVASFDDAKAATRVSLTLEPNGSVFVVFREAANRLDPAVAITCGGKLDRMLTEAPAIVVHKATYGVPGDRQRTRDVRAAIHRRIALGDQRIEVADLAAENDPAPGVAKTLIVDYQIGDQTFSVRNQDGGTVLLSDAAVRITVEKAAYGVLSDPQRTREVKAKVQRLADAGEGGLMPVQLAYDDNPAPGISKRLVLEYTINDQRKVTTSIDYDLLMFAPAKDTSATAKVTGRPDGQLYFEASRSGNYEVKRASGKVDQISVTNLPASQEIEGAWDVLFPTGHGAPEQVTMPKLESWSKHANANIRYFSGTATYQKTFTLPVDFKGKKRRVYLDLGRVEAIGQVRLNGKDLGVCWKPPYRLDVTDTVTVGGNRLEVQVTNLWPNRLIGDERLPEDSQRNPSGTLKAWPDWLLRGEPSPTGRHTFTTWRLWKSSDLLEESGLLGPVRLSVSEVVVLPK